MIKWFLFTILLLISAPRLSYAATFTTGGRNISHIFSVPTISQRDTTVTKGSKPSSDDDKKKIKEIAKAKKLPKPEKVEEADVNANKPATKPKRQRRPDGVERPPEIPRRNN